MNTQLQEGTDTRDVSAGLVFRLERPQYFQNIVPSMLLYNNVWVCFFDWASYAGVLQTHPAYFLQLAGKVLSLHRHCLLHRLKTLSK